MLSLLFAAFDTRDADAGGLSGTWHCRQLAVIQAAGVPAGKDHARHMLQGSYVKGPASQPSILAAVNKASRLLIEVARLVGTDENPIRA
jgi:hypothetical protein